MSEIHILGGTDFTLGFSLAGIQNIHNTDESDVKKDFNRLLSDETVGIIVTDQKTISRLDKDDQMIVESSVNPVVIVLSAVEGAQNNLREQIKRSIGVDIWKV